MPLKVSSHHQLTSHLKVRRNLKLPQRLPQGERVRGVRYPELPASTAVFARPRNARGVVFLYKASRVCVF